jgi:trehalose 6-phosphate synthase
MRADDREIGRRMKAMRKHVLEHDIDYWASAFIDELTASREKHGKRTRPVG